MEDFLNKNYKDLIASVLIVICLLALIFLDNRISASLRQTLGYIIVGCLGFLFGGNIQSV